jgi:raffinose/stachyose/melibiose transport system permease protein
MPALVLFLIFTYYPLIRNVSYSLTSWDGYSREKAFIGLKNFATVLSDKTLTQSVGNTFYLAAALLLVGLVLQLSSALIVFTKVKGHNIIKLVLYLPAVLSPIVLSYTWIQFLQYPGYINQVLSAIGMESSRTMWLGNQDTVKLVLCMIQSLQYTGYGMIFFLTGLGGVPKELYEAAEMDGCRGIRLFFRITLPLIMPAVTVTLFISITGALNTYALPFALTGGGPNGASTTITMQIYHRAFNTRQFGYASTIGIVLFLIIAAITSVQLFATRRREVEY